MFVDSNARLIHLSLLLTTIRRGGYANCRVRIIVCGSDTRGFESDRKPCDIEVPSITYLNEKGDRKLQVDNFNASTSDMDLDAKILLADYDVYNTNSARVAYVVPATDRSVVGTTNRTNGVVPFCIMCPIFGASRRASQRTCLLLVFP